MSILVLGTVALDSVKTPHGNKNMLLGGSASHFAMSGRLFTRVELAAVIGEDFPRKYLNFLKAKGINLDSLIKEHGESFKWEGEYQGDLNTAITLHTHLGVLSSFRPRITQAQKRIKNVFLANVDPDIQGHLLKKMQGPELVVLDSMNFWINHKKQALLRVLKKADIFVANDQEARSLTQEHNLLKAARHLRSLGPKMVLIKKGEHGVLFLSNDFVFALPAYPNERVIDPTGAGDTFAGGFMGYLASQKKIKKSIIKKAIVFGTIAASFNVEDFGLKRTSRLSLRELNARLKNFKEIVSF